jgi:alkylation response protein AidB-like acyl-CoA dehydrogenase
MSGFSLLIITLGLIWVFSFFGVPLIVWTVLSACILFVFSSLHWLGAAAWIIWPLFIAGAAFLNISTLRRLATQKIFFWFQSVLPPMSVTEKEAIEAGDVWWEKELFQGRPDWQQLIDMPKPMLTKEEQAFLNNQVETLCDLLNDWEITHEYSDLPTNVWEYIKKEKFFGMIIPKEYGGLAFSPLAHSAVITKIATRSVSAAVTTMVPNSLGPAELLLQYGTEDQKKYYLPRLADGKEIPCFALTGPEAGSDAGAIPDKGIVCKGMFEGKEVVGIRLTFDKRYITLAPVATVFGLAFKLFDPEHLLSEKTERGITLCLIPANHKGVEIGHRHFPLNCAFMNGPIRGQDVFVPLDWIIGGVKMAGAGWRMLMECLSAGRGISLPSLSTATGILCYRMTGAYAAIRKQFSTSIGAFEGVTEALARIAGFTYLLQAARTFTAGALCQEVKPAVATAIAKYHMTEMSRQIMNDAMDIHGGRGIMLGPNNYLARGYQAVPVSITVEGANILTRSLIIFGQGAIRCHPFAKEEMKAAELFATDSAQALKQFDYYCFKHAGYFITNLSKCITFSLSRGWFSNPIINDHTRVFVKKINWMSAALAVSADVALFTLGGDLKRRESISARLADVLSQLYLATSVIKQYIDQGRHENDWPQVSWCLQTCLYKAQEAFYGLFANFPLRWIGILLKCIIFPYGKAFAAPKDTLGQECASMMLTHSDVRQRLTDLCYIGKNVNDPTGLMETTFHQHIASLALQLKLSHAIKAKEINKNLSYEQQLQAALSKKILNETEVATLQEYDLIRKKAIAVDEFSSDYALGNQIQCKTKQINAQIG